MQILDFKTGENLKSIGKQSQIYSPRPSESGDGENSIFDTARDGVGLTDRALEEAIYKSRVHMSDKRQEVIRPEEAFDRFLKLASEGITETRDSYGNISNTLLSEAKEYEEIVDPLPSASESLRTRDLLSSNSGTGRGTGKGKSVPSRASKDRTSCMTSLADSEAVRIQKSSQVNPVLRTKYRWLTQEVTYQPWPDVEYASFGILKIGDSNHIVSKIPLWCKYVPIVLAQKSVISEECYIGYILMDHVNESKTKGKASMGIEKNAVIPIFQFPDIKSLYRVRGRDLGRVIRMISNPTKRSKVEFFKGKKDPLTPTEVMINVIIALSRISNKKSIAYVNKSEAQRGREGCTDSLSVSNYWGLHPVTTKMCTSVYPFMHDVPTTLQRKILFSHSKGKVLIIRNGVEDPRTNSRFPAKMLELIYCINNYFLSGYYVSGLLGDTYTYFKVNHLEEHVLINEHGAVGMMGDETVIYRPYSKGTSMEPVKVPMNNWCVATITREYGAKVQIPPDNRHINQVFLDYYNENLDKVQDKIAFRRTPSKDNNQRAGSSSSSRLRDSSKRNITKSGLSNDNLKGERYDGGL
jgi:hypothetical protein